jgi:peptidyl-prolyl cis-trans isomerase SurA
VISFLSSCRFAGLSLSAGVLLSPAGVTRLQDISLNSIFRRSAVPILLGASLLAAVAGCHRSPSADVVATVNGKEILRSDLDRLYQANIGDGQQTLSPEEANIRRLSLLHGMITDEIVQQRAAKLNLVASDEDVNAKLTEFKAPYTQDDFDRRLKQSNMTLDDLKRDIRRSLTRDKLVNKEIESKIDITDAEVSTYYNAHKSDFNLIEPRYHLAQILVTTAPSQQPGNLQNNKASGDADAKRKIQALHNRLESGEDFSSVAMNFSEDSSTANNGGDMGFIGETALKSVPVVFDAVGKLKPGQFTDVIPAVDANHRTLGYAIYRFISRDPAGQRDLTNPSVKQSIHTQLHNNRAQMLENAYFERLQNDAKIHNYLADQILKAGGQ